MSRSFRILVVDDDRDNAESLAEVFVMEGHQVEVAFSGESAIEAYSRSTFDIAFMDVMMPGLNGVDSFLEIRRRHPQANVYMMTGYSVEQLLRQAIDHGAIGVLTKPVDPYRVLETLNAAMEGGILVVEEDDAGIAAKIQDIVGNSGGICELVTDGNTALDRIGSRKIDVLVLDLDAPLIDGIGVYSALRQQGKSIPTIMLTACADNHSDFLAGLEDVKVTGILTKPFDITALLSGLEQLADVGKRRMVPA